MVIKSFKPIILVKSAVILYVVDLQYVLITSVVNVDYKCCR